MRIDKEDVTRFFLNSIGSFSPLPALSVFSLGLIDHSVITTAIAVVTSDQKLVGEISPFTLANLRDTSAAAAIATLSAGELMTPG
ncbi:CBS domain-containing protein CBSX5 [Acorus calamus]|uniref:CBS domain-containing protein CBSX5 n=1 Tax=Acorus calamus TaxID=4465 RepID=A0AAV9DC73_ACOCL|nr:CBS domain-containing protein CBSX5 [Acorus calamus]